MIASILTLSMVIQAVACVFLAFALVAKDAAGDCRKAVRARPSRFPGLSLPDPAASKNFSLLTRPVSLVQALDFMENCRSKQADFGAENKKLPYFRQLAGKFDPAEETCRNPVPARHEWRCWFRLAPSLPRG
jgi:hypothetical protein